MYLISIHKSLEANESLEVYDPKLTFTCGDYDDYVASTLALMFVYI